MLFLIHTLSHTHTRSDKVLTRNTSYIIMIMTVIITSAIIALLINNSDTIITVCQHATESVG